MGIQVKQETIHQLNQTRIKRVQRKLRYIERFRGTQMQQYIKQITYSIKYISEIGHYSVLIGPFRAYILLADKPTKPQQTLPVGDRAPALCLWLSRWDPVRSHT